MADTKRDYLYNFSNKLRDINSFDPSIVSVFENIDNKTLSLSPEEIANFDFVNKVDKCIFIIKKILAMPYKSVEGKQTVFPVSQAEKVNKDSVRLTLADHTLWTVSEGKKVPKFAYSLTNEDVCLNYENAFIYHFINALVLRLKSIRTDFTKTRGIGVDGVESKEQDLEFHKRISTQISKLIRMSKEPTFASNSNRTVDLSNIFLTDTIKSDKRYNFCYKFYCLEFKSNKKRTNVTTDFRVLYHNFALFQILYNLYKNGYSISDKDKLQISISGKAFIGSIQFQKDDKVITVSRTRNGIDLISGEKACHVEFAKSFMLDASAINEDCKKRVEKLKKNSAYTNIFVAYLSSESNLNDSVLSIGYKPIDLAMEKMLQAI